MLYRRFVKPIIFNFSPEYVHKVTENTSGITRPICGIVSRFNGCSDTILETNLADIKLPSPLGASAGIDKNFKITGNLLNLGFGFAVCGTITKNQRRGNPYPRLVRLPAQNAVINTLGFPNPGLQNAVIRMTKLNKLHKRIFVSISGESEDDIIECYKKLAMMCALIELNISSPNTEGIKVFQNPSRLKNLLELLVKEDISTPLFVKLTPWSSDASDISKSINLAEIALASGAKGIVVANTREILTSKLSTGKGGLSGSPLLPETKRMLSQIRDSFGKNGNYYVIASGGVSCAEDVWDVISRGASAVEIYTSLIYEGPLLPMRINRRLAKMMRVAKIENIYQIEGQSPNLPKTNLWKRLF